MRGTDWQLATFSTILPMAGGTPGISPIEKFRRRRRVSWPSKSAAPAEPMSDALTRTVAAEVSKAYSYVQHGNAEAAFAHLIPDDVVPRFAFSGRAETIAAQIDAYAVGTDEIILAIPFAPGIARLARGGHANAWSCLALE